MKRTFTIKNLAWRIAAILIIGIFSLSKVQAQCTTGCTTSLNVTLDPNGTLVATANGQTLCLQGSGNFNGIVDFGGFNGITLCIGPGVTFNAFVPNLGATYLQSRIINVNGNTKVINNYGTLNLHTFGSTTPLSIVLENIAFNNYGTTNMGSAFLPVTVSFGNGPGTGGQFINYTTGTLNVIGILNVVQGGTLTSSGKVSILDAASFIPPVKGTLNILGGGNVSLTSSQSFGITDLNISGGNLSVVSSLLQVTGNYTQSGGSVSGGNSPLLPGSGCGSINVALQSTISGGTFGQGSGLLGLCDPSTSNVAANITGFDSAPGGTVRPNATLKCNCFVALPVQFVYFRAVYSEGQIKLNWATASEENNDYFTVERSKDGINFTEVSRVKGAGTTSALRTYQSVDAQPYEGASYYRVKQTDLDGKFSYSTIRVVNAGTSSRLASIFPNPVAQDGFVQVAVNSEQTGDIYVTVYDQIGKQCFTAKYASDAIPSIAVKQFSTHSGLYIIQARKGNTIVREKVIVQ